MKEFLMRLLRQRVDMIVLLDGHLHTKPYDINKPEPQISIGYERN